jgi:CO dehydrogenase nickel-insertion accessory protein CooC1
LNKISSETLIAEIKAKLKNSEMETIGVIPYDASVFLCGLKGATLTQVRATHQAGEILEFLLTAKKNQKV